MTVVNDVAAVDTPARKELPPSMVERMTLIMDTASSFHSLMTAIGEAAVGGRIRVRSDEPDSGPGTS
ncbi:hypothetical protein [Streptomyces sp. NPDC002790]|uniref:hypothetical protein n=1 Tax=Streptomyces sp. NPDC002790 TaxID=3154431 RepID=UPI003329E5BF